MCLYDGSRHPQPEPRAGHPVVEAHSRLEDPALLGGRNARALIRDGDPNHVAASDRGDDDPGSAAVRQRVREEIVEHLPQSRGVRIDTRNIRGDLGLHDCPT